jgi:hypothetical protein
MSKVLENQKAYGQKSFRKTSKVLENQKAYGQKSFRKTLSRDVKSFKIFLLEILEIFYLNLFTTILALSCFFPLDVT